MPWSSLAPVGFLQNLAGDVDEEGRIFGPYGRGSVGYVDARDIAAAAAALLTRPVGADATYDLTGPVAPTHDEIAAELTRALRRTVRHIDLTVEEAAVHQEKRGVSTKRPVTWPSWINANDRTVSSRGWVPMCEGASTTARACHAASTMDTTSANDSGRGEQEPAP
uniref:hypothetical protein n=1 Tax=Nonomuraea pusilla TaxID=46177 RepID=UPI0006E45B57|nr:hypothetical protein [Nonomuraea pusilla]